MNVDLGQHRNVLTRKYYLNYLVTMVTRVRIGFRKKVTFSFSHCFLLINMSTGMIVIWYDWEKKS